MPYKRGYRKRYYRKKNGTLKKIGGYVDTATKVASLGMKVASIAAMVNCEKKHHDSAASSTIPTTGYVLALSNIQTGDDFTERTGRSLLLKSLLCKFQLLQNASAVETKCRVMIVQFKDCNGVAPSLSDIVSNTSVPYNIISAYNPNNCPARINVLYDQMFEMNNSLTTSFNRIKLIKFKKTHLKYIGTGNSIADMGQNSLFLVVTSNQSTNTPTLNFYSRMYYYDN